MPICPRCDVAFFEDEPHVCAERTEDRSKRVFWIFVCVLLLPFPIGIALGRADAPALPIFGFVLHLAWQAFVFPHDVLHVGRTTTLVFPGWIAPAVAITQWVSTFVVVVFLKRRLKLSPNEQIVAAFSAIVLVGVAFWVLALFRGWQMPRMDI